MYLSINRLWPLKISIITSHPTHNRSNQTLFLNDFGPLRRTVGPKLPPAIKEPRQGTGFSQPSLNAKQRKHQLCVLPACSSSFHSERWILDSKLPESVLSLVRRITMKWSPTSQSPATILKTHPFVSLLKLAATSTPAWR